MVLRLLLAAERHEARQCSHPMIFYYDNLTLTLEEQDLDVRII